MCHCAPFQIPEYAKPLQDTAISGVLVTHFYRAMHFGVKRGIAIACRLSVRPSVCNVGRL